jgi:hypothetical protein
MTIPLERYNLDSPLRLNVLWRTTAETAGTLVLRRAFADDGDVTRMPLLQLAEQPNAKAKAFKTSKSPEAKVSDPNGL